VQWDTHRGEQEGESQRKPQPFYWLDFERIFAKIVNMQLVKKAIIPAAGLGTRMLSLTKGTPKEMLIIGSKPMIQHTVEMSLDSGIKEICVIINEKKTVIRDFLMKYWKEYLSHKCKLTFLYQSQPKGLADAVYLAKEFVGDEPFVLSMPDAILFSKTPTILQLSCAFAKYNQNVMGVIYVGSEEANLFGNVGVLDITYLEKNIFRVNKLSEKGPGTLKIDPGQTVAKSFGVGIYLPHYFHYIDAIRPQVRGELDDVPLLQRLTQDKNLLGVLLEGKGFDVGNVDGYYAANNYLNSLHTSYLWDLLL